MLGVVVDHQALELAESYSPGAMQRHRRSRAKSSDIFQLGSRLQTIQRALEGTQQVQPQCETEPKQFWLATSARLFEICASSTLERAVGITEKALAPDTE